jgi:hypothetical protein
MRAARILHFDEQPVLGKCLWLLLATFMFLACFYAGTILMSVVYPLDAAPVAF